ncbi:MAG: sodium-dependent tyrosine transporter [Arcobacteraceae bacterium]|nr:sodium-dependent tyrosine transporter [Arcobacteraceae bacterium]
MFIQLNERVYLNFNKITRTKIDHVEDGIRVRFYEGQDQVAKSQKFDDVDSANKWLSSLLEKVNKQFS